MGNLNRKLREIQEKIPYEERFRLSIDLVVLGELGSEKFYKEDAEVMKSLVRAGIIRRIPVRRQKEKGWYEPASAEVGRLPTGL
ncbi:MAG: hypothetical protein KGI71_01765 [Patescibacteria group bacterium]|nr:hypothetical protein [Patescibacteria group bacterium]